ncbi:MAG: response regulator transcription factor [Clostridiales bacterium]|nr:response regulator transcription factor [Clostridiales bacterium]
MIAIVEDDESIAALEQYALRSNGMDAAIYHDGAAFFRGLETSLPELVILDVMLPDLDGLMILQRLRENHATRHVPVMMVTARGSEVDIVQGLDGGADDYLTKPFGIMEFLSRVKALLRRTGREQGGKTLSFGPIAMQEDRHQVTVEGRPVELTLKEYELLRLFLQSPETAITRDDMMDRVWRSEYSVESRTVDMHIRSLRQKLGDAGRYIQTLRKVGYILTDRESAGQGR